MIPILPISFGKSLLINRIVSQELFVVNVIPGTNTNPISKAVELLPYGPVIVIDTAGIDDDEFDKKRLNRTIKTISSADFAILVLDARDQLDKNETDLITHLQKLKTPFLVAVNKIEFGINANLLTELEALEVTRSRPPPSYTASADVGPTQEPAPSNILAQALTQMMPALMKIVEGYGNKLIGNEPEKTPQQILWQEVESRYEAKKRAEMAASPECVEFAVFAGLAEGQRIVELHSIIEFAKFQQREIAGLECVVGGKEK